MILIDNFSQVVAQIETERGIQKEEIVEAIEQALVSACKRRYNDEVVLEAEINEITGESKIFRVYEVVDSVEDEDTELSLKAALNKDSSVKVGDSLRVEITPDDFGRLAAQTAKQVIVQRIREAEKNAVLSEFRDKVGTIVSGTVQKKEGETYLINLGSTEALLIPKEQIPGESFQIKERVRLYVQDVELLSKGPRVKVSRGQAGLVRCLFELEIPEIQEGIIEIKSVSREPGKRTKIAVKSNDSNVGAVGTCVGHMGGRIQAIIKEIGQEKIDILEWHEDPKVYIASSLKPAKVAKVEITDEDDKVAAVTVEADQLSLAIGKSGSNVRLASRLTGWRIDLQTEEDQVENEELSLAEKIQKSSEEQSKELEESDNDTIENAVEKNTESDSGN